MNNNNWSIIIFFFILLCIYKLFYKNNYNNIEQFITYNLDFKKFHKDYGFKMKDNNLMYKNGKTIQYTKTLNRPTSVKITSNKHLTKQLLNKHNIPIPKGMTYNRDMDNIDNFIKQINFKLTYPLIIKPTNMSNAIDVYVNIKNENKLRELILLLEKKYKNLIIEEMIKGDLFRILMVNHKVIDILIRKSAVLIGNNINSIEELIKIKNKEIKETHKEKNINIIKKIDLDYLKDQGYHLNDVPKKNKKILVSIIPNSEYGRTIETININKVHPDNIQLFETISKISNSIILGIDYITKDITKSYKEQGSIIELNANPHYTIHKQNKKDYSIINKIFKNLQKYFENL